MGTHPIFESDFDCLTDKMNYIVLFLFSLVVGDSVNRYDRQGLKSKLIHSAQMRQMKKQLCRPITCNKCHKLVTKWIDIAKLSNINRCLRVLALPNCCEQFRNFSQSVFAGK